MFVTYLKSYTPMGSGVVTCSGGCSCEQMVIDAHEKEHKFSQSFLARLIVSYCELLLHSLL